MARTLNRLTAREVAALKEPGRHADGGGLYLRITTAGARSWVFMAAIGGKRVEVGLGGSSAVSLATARRIATEMREAVATGADPRAVLAPVESTEAKQKPTFGEFAETYIASVEAGWKNAVHRQQWRNSLRDHAAALRDVPIDEVTTDHVLAVLTPIWLSKAETANRVRGRIERVLDAAKAREFRSRDSTNPAAWRGHLAALMPAKSKLVRGHHPALRWKEAPVFVAALRTREALAARCLEFVILTAARSGEVLEATWDEIDLKEGTWTVPAVRMKAGAEHVVPLSPAAISLLESLHTREAKPTDPIFAVGGATRSNMAMTMLLRRMGCSHVTTHGFRSTFRDWAGDDTAFPRELIEQALAHTIGNKAERAYRRGTALERRRSLMTAWSDFLSEKETTDDGSEADPASADR